MRRRSIDAEVEPADLEPIVLETSPASPAPRRVSPGRAAAIGVIVVGGWIGVAFATGHHANHVAAPRSRAADPTPTTAPDLSPSFVDALKTIGSGRFAAIVNNELYVIDARAGVGTRVDLGIAPRSIEARSGHEVLVRTADGEVIVDTTGLGLDAIPSDRRAFSSYDGTWWIVGNDGTFSRNGGVASTRLPSGLTVVGSNANAFVATFHGNFVLWSTFDSTVRILGATAGRAFVDAGATWTAFAKTCYDGPCAELFGADGSDRTFEAIGSGSSVELSPDGRRAAVGHQVVDRATGRVLAILPFPLSTTGDPFTWTSDGTLVVARDEAIAVLPPGKTEPKQIIGLTGIQQIVALP